MGCARFNVLARGKTRLAKWYAPYSVSEVIVLKPNQAYGVQDEEKVKLKGEVGWTMSKLVGVISDTLRFTA